MACRSVDPEPRQRPAGLFEEQPAEIVHSLVARAPPVDRAKDLFPVPLDGPKRSVEATEKRSFFVERPEGCGGQGFLQPSPICQRQ